MEKENKIIADFMGVEKENGLYLFTTPMDDYKTDTLYFDVSWDWLMPVVEKIKDMGYDQELDKIDNVLACDLRIENLYNAVVEFIKFYNETK